MCGSATPMRGKRATCCQYKFLIALSPFGRGLGEGLGDAS